MQKLLQQAVTRYTWSVLLLSLCLIALCGFGASKLYFRGDYKIFFGHSNPQLLAFESMQKTFNKNDNIGIVVAPEDGDVFTAENLTLLWNLTEDAWQIPYSSRVDSITNFQHTQAEQDDLLVEPLVLEPEELDAEKLQHVKQVALNEPVLLKKLISEAGDVAMVNITVQLPDKVDQTAEVQEIVSFTRDLVKKYQNQYPTAQFRLIGVVMMNNGFYEESQKDASSLIPGMFVAIILMLALLLRSVTATLCTLLIIIVSNVTTLGIAGWAGYYLSTATVNVPIIVMTLAVADCVHIASSMLFDMQQGSTKADAIKHSLRLNMKPVFITSITTAIGFLTFNFSDVPPLQDLGNLVALGVVFAWIFSITLFPALLMMLPIKVKPQSNQKNGAMEKFAEWVIKQQKTLLIVMGIVIIGGTALTPLNSVNDIPLEYFDTSLKFRQDNDFMQARLSGMTLIDLELDSERASGVNSPQFLEMAEDFSNWVRSQSELDHLATLTDIFKRLNKNMHGDDDSWYRLPEQQDLAAQYLLMYEMSLPYGLDLNNQLNIDKSAMRMTLTLKNLGSHELTGFEQKIRDWFTTHYPEQKIEMSSVALMFAHIGERNMASMLLGTSVAAILISVLLIFALKDLRLGLISLIPNLAPAGIGFGLWALYNGNINLGLSVVTSMCLGIVVDDTVHFLSKYQYSRRQGNNAEDAIRYAFSSVGRALWITTLVLFVGFMVLTLSAFTLNSYLGLLTAVIILLALVVDFLFLPAFLLLLDKRVYQEGNSHA
ncbi:efflux RND transporter permease subunit [Neptunicella marina]|uniref:efflux RND transporter permease subunit n=1 Tax=Neptunicella marina TaxID=2125989 RepID=UPI0019D5040D|nr:MMPL family transporter [Neptunicella marina]